MLRLRAFGRLASPAGAVEALHHEEMLEVFFMLFVPSWFVFRVFLFVFLR
jgi:hypothetical protein